jgi:hypothetical protein
VRRPDSPRPSLILMSNETLNELSRLHQGPHHQNAQALSDERLPDQDEQEQLPPYEPAPPPYSPFP